MKRHETLVVPVGTVPVGGFHPVSIEAMGRTHPSDPLKALEEIHRANQAGCEIFRLAIPDRKALEGLLSLHSKSPVPLIADIHFTPELAWEAVRSGIEGVRINPGTLHSQAKYENLIDSLKDSSTVLRLGANAGSLPKKYRAKNRIDALVESIGMFLEAPERKNFHRIILSAKSSEIEETIEVNQRLSSLYSYPLHIGLTEAGEGMEGVIKSTLGVGILLREGIGNTIRISLTATDPVPETRAAWVLLQSLDLTRGGIEIISCPTCARKRGDVISLVCALKNILSNRRINKKIKIAVMGCEVNGPGEARQADLGLALGKETVLIFAGGTVIKTVPQDQGVEAFLNVFQTIFPESLVIQSTTQ